MARKTKEEAHETYRSILDAALDVFYEKGVRATSLEDIAGAAGVTRGAVYWHFKNKNDICSALHEHVHTSFLGRLVETQGNPPGDILEHLASHCIDTFEEIDSTPALRKFFTVFYFKCDYSGDLAFLLEQQNEQRAQAFSVVTDLFQKAIDEKQLSGAASPHLLALSLFCFAGGLLNEYLRDPDLIDLKTQLRPLIKNFFSVMK